MSTDTLTVAPAASAENSCSQAPQTQSQAQSQSQTPSPEGYGAEELLKVAYAEFQGLIQSRTEGLRIIHFPEPVDAVIADDSDQRTRQAFAVYDSCTIFEMAGRKWVAALGRVSGTEYLAREFCGDLVIIPYPENDESIPHMLGKNFCHAYSVLIAVPAALDIGASPLSLFVKHRVSLWEPIKSVVGNYVLQSDRYDPERVNPATLRAWADQHCIYSKDFAPFLANVLFDRIVDVSKVMRG